MKRAPHYEIRRNTIGEWFYRIIGANGEPLGPSESYKTKANAVRQVKKLIASPPKTYKVVESESLKA